MTATTALIRSVVGQRCRLNFLRRAFDLMIEGQELTAENLLHAHLNTLPDSTLENYGFTQFEIKEIRKPSKLTHII